MVSPKPSTKKRFNTTNLPEKMEYRNSVLETVETEGVDELEETLKWVKLSYLDQKKKGVR
jgi:hypothetical protein